MSATATAEAGPSYAERKARREEEFSTDFAAEVCSGLFGKISQRISPSSWRQNLASLGGGNSNVFLNFQPEPWGDDQI